MTGKKLTMWSTLASCWSVHLSHFTTDNHGQKQLRHSPNKTCFVERMFFQSPISHFDPLSPFQCCNHGTVSTERISTLKKGRGGFGYQQKRCFLKLQKDTDRECLFCSNMWTLVSMIVWNCLSAKINRNCSIYVSKILKYHKHCNRNWLVVV